MYNNFHTFDITTEHMTSLNVFCCLKHRVDAHQSTNNQEHRDYTADFYEVLYIYYQFLCRFCPFD